MKRLLFEKNNSFFLNSALYRHLPNHNNAEIEQVPSVPQVSVGMKKETHSDYLQERFNCKYCQKHVFNALLNLNQIVNSVNT